MVSLTKKFVSYSTCTLFGAGYFPLAPGSFTSMLAAVLVFHLQPETSFFIAAILIAFGCGVLFSREIEKNDGKDPRHIVIDELTGQWLTFLFVSKITFLTVISGFILFRFFDIYKPMGVNTLQELKNGWGVMMDDVLAGFYANLVLQMLIITGILV